MFHITGGITVLEHCHEDANIEGEDEMDGPKRNLHGSIGNSERGGKSYCSY